MNFVKDAFDTNWVAPLGPNVDGFEGDLAKFLDTSNVAALSSGTAALHLALILAGVTQGDEVICQSMTFSASANPIVYLGAEPVFVDSEMDTWNMDPALLEEAILDRKAKGKLPKAIIIVHLYGMPAKMDELLAIADKYEISLIEDAAEALGSSYNGKKCGTFGEFSILSFNGNKIITTSGGGALVGRSEELVKKARFLATQARDNAPHYQHTHIGYNYRISNICAGIGRGQMKVLSQRVAQRRANFMAYVNGLADLSGLKFLHEPEGFFSNRWLTTILVGENQNGVDREVIRKKLETQNIESRPLWKPMHLQPVFSKSVAYVNGNSEQLFDSGLCLPSGSNLREEQVRNVVDTIRSLYK